MSIIAESDTVSPKTIAIDEKLKPIFTKSRPGMTVNTVLSADAVSFVLEVAELHAGREDLETYSAAIIQRKFPLDTIVLLTNLCDILGYTKLLDAAIKVLSDIICSKSEAELRQAFDVTDDFSPELAKELDRERQFM
jgi:hypothetical protein